MAGMCILTTPWLLLTTVAYSSFSLATTDSFAWTQSLPLSSSCHLSWARRNDSLLPGFSSNALLYPAKTYSVSLTYSVPRPKHSYSRALAHSEIWLRTSCHRFGLTSGGMAVVDWCWKSGSFGAAVRKRRAVPKLCRSRIAPPGWSEVSPADMSASQRSNSRLPLQYCLRFKAWVDLTVSIVFRMHWC